jgi:hypothetical protein
MLHLTHRARLKDELLRRLSCIPHLHSTLPIPPQTLPVPQYLQSLDQHRKARYRRSRPRLKRCHHISTLPCYLHSTNHWPLLPLQPTVTSATTSHFLKIWICSRQTFYPWTSTPARQISSSMLLQIQWTLQPAISLQTSFQRLVKKLLAVPTRTSNSSRLLDRQSLLPRALCAPLNYFDNTRLHHARTQLLQHPLSQSSSHRTAPQSKRQARCSNAHAQEMGTSWCW